MVQATPQTTNPEMRKLLHDVNDELSIAVMQLEMMLENGTIEAQSRESLEESLDACRKAATSLKQVWVILGPRQTT
jgi:cob(I)alamin adenosyltransferase